MDKFEQATNATENLRDGLKIEGRNDRKAIINYWVEILKRPDLDMQQKASLISESISYEGVNDNGGLEWFATEAGRFIIPNPDPNEWSKFISNLDNN